MSRVDLGAYLTLSNAEAENQAGSAALRAVRSPPPYAPFGGITAR
jgi:hypothetical protein